MVFISWIDFCATHKFHSPLTHIWSIALCWDNKYPINTIVIVNIVVIWRNPLCRDEWEQIGHERKVEFTKILIVHGCYELEELLSMETLPSLEELLAYVCVKLKNTWGLVQCTKLRVLDVDGWCELQDLECLEYYTCLEKFYSYGCPKFQTPVYGGGSNGL